MWRTTIALLLTIGVLLAAGAGGCDKNKQADEKREKEIAEQTKRDAAKTAPQDKFEASEDPPLKAGTRFAAGQLAEAQGNFDNAIAQYREAIKLDPNHKAATFRLGG